MSCYFDNIKNNFKIIDYKTGEKVCFNENSFRADLKSYTLKIEHNKPNLLYYEVNDKRPYTDENKVGGYILNNDSYFEKEILSLLNIETQEYFEYINKMKDKSDNVLPKFYEDNINAVLTRDSDCVKKELFLNKK